VLREARLPDSRLALSTLAPDDEFEIAHLVRDIGELKRLAEQPAPSASDRPSTTERGRAGLALADPRAGPFDSTTVAPMPPEDSEAVQDTRSSLLLAEVGVIRHGAPPPADAPHRRPQAWLEPEKQIHAIARIRTYSHSLAFARIRNAHSLAFARIRVRSHSHGFATERIRTYSHPLEIARIRNRAYSHWTPWCSATFQA